MEKGEARHENIHIKRVKNKHKTSNTIRILPYPAKKRYVLESSPLIQRSIPSWKHRSSNNLYSGSSEKKRLAIKEPSLRIKNNKLRHSNVKDFQGRRHDSRENNVKSIWLETGTEGSKKSRALCNEKPVILLTKNKQNPPPDSASSSKVSSEINKTPPKNIKNDTKAKYNFDEHMAQWAEQLCKPLVVPSTNVKFEMPYCYSEEFYSKLSANCYMMQPFSSIGDPVLMWNVNSYVDVWYEKAQLALQFYRQLSVQPSRSSLQLTTIKGAAQFVAEQCTMLGTQLYFETFEDDARSILDGSVAVMGKKNHSVYLVSDGTVQNKIELVNAQVKNDNSIYTESWQN